MPPQENTETITTSDNQQETDTFLTEKSAKNGDVKVEIASGGKCPMQLIDKSDVDSKRCPCSCCSWKRCGIGFAIIVGILIIVCGVGYWRVRNKYAGTAESLGKDEILLRISDNEEAVMSGNYILESYDENYRTFLESMGTPSLVVSMIIDFNDIYVFKAPVDQAKEWSWYSDTPTGKFTFKFKLGKEFQVPWGKRDKGIFYKMCKVDEAKSNVLNCEYEERKKNWRFLETLTFVQDGMLQELDFQTTNVQTVRFFKRLTDEQLNEITSSENSPFSDTADDDFASSDWNDEEDF